MTIDGKGIHWLVRTGLTACVVFLSLLAVVRGMPGQEDSGTPPDYLKRFLRRAVRENSFARHAASGFSSWQSQARPALAELVGLPRIARHVGGHAPGVELGAVQQRDGHSLRKGWITTEPDVRLPFWLLKPDGDGPFPLAVLPHGHDTRGQDTHAGVFHDEAHRERTLQGDRDVAVQAVRRGFLAVAPAVRGLSKEANLAPDLGERHGGRDCRSHLVHALLLGRTAIGERVWDMSRLLDWALARPDVDGKTVLMLGNSGGGMVTLYTAALDPRVTVAIPSSSFSAAASKHGRIYHCDCNAVPGLLAFGDLYDVAGLVAPRWLLTVSGRTDRLHVVEEVDRAAERVQAIYTAAGVPGRYEHRWGAKGHRFYAELMWPFVLATRGR